MKMITLISLVPAVLLGAASCSDTLNNDQFIPEDSMPISDSSVQWKHESLGEGLTYHTFSALDVVSKAQQMVYVLEVDLNNPAYAVQFYINKNGSTCSDAVKSTGAIAGMNAGYELSSIFVRIDGTEYTAIPNLTVGSTDVPQWKSSAALYCDNDRDVRIEYTGKGLTVDQQRQAYRMSESRNIISSAPMLVDYYDPVGEQFVDYSLTDQQWQALNYEDPNRHQRARHPRSAVALTGDNHLLLFVVDGRRTYISEGMNARELTQFLVRYFHPRYAINMDGGGSSTLVIKGKGGASNNVVNFPTDGSTFDHTGVRRVSTHILIQSVR